MPKISVIMLTYNREKLVSKAIESILAQTFKDFEFIIIDNGSSDNSLSICNKYAKEDNRIKLIHISKSTIGVGRNKGLDNATGDFITFVDDDDIADKDFLEVLYSSAKKNEADISICGAYIEKGKEVSLYGSLDNELVMKPEEAVINLMWRKKYNTGFPTKLIARKLFNEYRFLENGKYEDIHLMYKIMADSNKVVACGVPKYHVRYHGSNNSTVTRKDSLITSEYLEEYRKAYQLRTDWLSKKFPGKKNYWEYFNLSFQISMVNKILTNDISGCDLQLKEMKDELIKSKDTFLTSSHLLDLEKNWMEEYIGGTRNRANK